MWLSLPRTEKKGQALQGGRTQERAQRMGRECSRGWLRPAGRGWKWDLAGRFLGPWPEYPVAPGEILCKGCGAVGQDDSHQRAWEGRALRGGSTGLLGRGSGHRLPSGSRAAIC